jgi:hypothetical protein
MTRKKHFGYIWDRLMDIVKEHDVIYDADLMIKLDFSPPSWKVWKAKFKEKSDYTRITFTRPDGTKTDHKITYHKKTKSWHWEDL